MTLTRLSHALIDISVNKDTVHFIGYSKLDLSDTLYEKFHEMLTTATKDFFEGDLMVNFGKDIEGLLGAAQKLDFCDELPASTQKDLIKIKANRLTKHIIEKVKELQKKVEKKEKEKGVDPKASVGENLFKGTEFGAYVAKKELSILTQKYALKMLKAEIKVFNTV